jgi:GT2 family glycosyltransferase
MMNCGIIPFTARFRKKAFNLDLSLVVVNWNARNLLRRCLTSAFAHTGRLACDVIAVDNASTDGSAEMVAAEFPKARLVRTECNLGYGAASNLGMRVAAGRYILVANADVEFVNDDLGEMARFLDEHPKVAAVGPKLLNPDGSLQPSCFSRLDAPTVLGIAAGFHNIMPYRWLLRHDPDGPVRRFFRVPDYDRVLYPEWFRAAVVMLRRDAVEAIGGYDEGFYMYCEEIDLFRRLRAGGWEVAYCPAAEVIHFGEGSSRRAARAMAVEYWKSLLRLSRKFPGSMPSPRLLWTLMMLGTMLRGTVLIAQMARRMPEAAERFCACGSVIEWGLGLHENRQ